MVESDAPWCELRPSHAGYSHVKTHWKNHAIHKEKYSIADPKPIRSRNEPMTCLQVLEAIASLKDMPVEEVAETIYENSIHVFSGIYQ